MMFKNTLAVGALLLCMGSAWAEDLDLVPSNQLFDRINELAKKGRETLADQTKMIWILVLRSSQGEAGLQKQGRPVAERLRSWDETNPRIRFALGFFRAKEGLSTLDPFTRKRRIDEGRRFCSESLTLGSKDADFLFDAGLVLIGMGEDMNMSAHAVNALTVSKRLFGAKFSEVPKSRQADYYAAMGIGLETVGLTELAREQYTSAATTSPDSPSGKKAVAWLRKNGPI
jgi:hypothetical protein